MRNRKVGIVRKLRSLVQIGAWLQAAVPLLLVAQSGSSEITEILVRKKGDPVTTRWDRVARVTAKLYSLSLSHPSQAARLMLERKGIET
jgi:hypothetical protein